MDRGTWTGTEERVGRDRGKGTAQGPRRVPEEGLLWGGPQAGLGGWAVGGDIHQEVACARGGRGCCWGRGCPQPQEVGRGRGRRLQEVRVKMSK